MKRTLSMIGALALAAWTAGGALAWWQAKGHWTLVVQEGAPSPSETDQRVALLGEELQTLSGDLRALSGLLEQNLGVLDERAAQREDEARAAVERELAALRAELARLRTGQEGADAALAALRAGWRADLNAALADRPAPELSPTAAAAAAPEPAPAGVEPEPALEAPPSLAETTPARRPSFLAFELPSDDFRLDQRRTWSVVPELSRVGFDAKSTLHDFTGTTSAVSGALSAALARPGEDPAADLRVVARSLLTGSEGRDEGMWDNLAVAEHPELRFVLTAFDVDEVDVEAGAVRGRARGTMTIRGAEREVAMPVRMSLDAAHRLSIEGELDLLLSDYGVPVPSKLGLVKMEDQVRVWIALRARLDPRGEG